MTDPLTKTNASSASTPIVPIWFWIVCVIALLWNLMGLSVFLGSVFALETLIAELTDAQKELYRNNPTWVMSAFAVAVIFGTLGCVGLLFRKRWALPVFVLSLIGVLVQQSYMFFLSDTLEVMGPGSAAMPIMVLIIAIALIFFSKWSIGRGWLR